MTQQLEHIEHSIEPVFDAHSRVLVLGTMPSPASRAARFFYGHPQNRFWRVMGALWDEPVPETAEERAAFALRHGIALWDVLASCEIAGASDASIRNARANDLERIIGDGTAALAPSEAAAAACSPSSSEAAPLSPSPNITAVFTTGTKAAALYRRLCAPRFPQLPHIALPSTSPANARMTLADLVAAYQPLKAATDAPEAGATGIASTASAAEVGTAGATSATSAVGMAEAGTTGTTGAPEASATSAAGVAEPSATSTANVAETGAVDAGATGAADVAEAGTADAAEAGSPTAQSQARP